MKTGHERLVKCECDECRCENATPKDDPDIDAVCMLCSMGRHVKEGPPPPRKEKP